MIPKVVEINSRKIGQRFSPYVVAELSGNHDGSLEKALKTMVEAKKAGADALKIQTYRADSITIDHDGPDFILEDGLWKGRKLYELYSQAATPWDWHETIFEKGKELNLTVFSSPFDRDAVEFLDSFDVPAYKIASPEIIDLPLIEVVASRGKPLVISTGMASEVEIEEAVSTAQHAGASDIILLHCISAYPTQPKDSNLLVLPDLSKKLALPVGLSDHTIDITTSLAAVALGAVFIEKHFTLCREDGGVDSEFSIEPKELRELKKQSIAVWEALGSAIYGPTEAERTTLKYRRSIYVVKDIGAGENISEQNIRSIRPSHGLAPKHIKDLIGKRATKDIKRGTPLNWDLIEK